MVHPPNAPNFAFRVCKRIREQQRKRNEEAVKRTNVRRVAQPEWEAGEAARKRCPQQRFLVIGGQLLDLGHPSFVGWHIGRLHEWVFN